MDNKNLKLGRRLRYFRERKGITQTELELVIDVSPGTISRIENGTINPLKETLTKIFKTLEMNNIEIDYCIGPTIEAASLEEIQKARDDVKEHFEKKGVLAYMIDDRTRFIDMSRSFKLMADLSDEDVNKLSGNYMQQIVLDDSLGLKKFLDPEKYNEVIKTSFSRGYDEIGFMVDDIHYKNIYEVVKLNPFAKKIWDDLKARGIRRVRSLDERIVYFKWHGIKMALEYSTETLWSNQRFKILEYKPTNLILRFLSKL